MGYASGRDKYGNTSFLVQTEAQSKGVMVHVTDTLCLDAENGDKGADELGLGTIPVIECLWKYCEKANMTATDLEAISFLSGKAGGAGMQSMKSSSDGIDLFRELLLKNRRRISPSYCRAKEANLP